MIDVIDGFVERLRRCVNIEQQFDVFAAEAGSVGFHQFTYVSFQHDPDSGRDFYFKTSYSPEWIDRYLERNYMLSDPVIIESMCGIVPIEWGTARAKARLSRKQRQIFDEAGEFGLKGGVTIPIHGFGGERATLSFGTPLDDAEFEKTWTVYRHVLHVMSIYLHSGLRRAQYQCAQNVKPVTLSDRERECVAWMAQGKTNWEVSEILSLSEKTVDWHLENVKRKLGVYTKTQAVVKAIMLGMIKP